MDRVKTMGWIAGVAVAGWMGAAAAQQPSQAPPRDQPQAGQAGNGNQAATPTEQVSATMHMTATVQKVDKAKRQLTLKDEAGNQILVQVPESVTPLDKIKSGDRLDIDYYESVALSLKKPGEGSTGPAESQVVARNEGQLPGGLVARKIVATAKVVKVDPAQNKVTIKGPNGDVDTVNVSDPAVQADLKKLKKGDQIQVTYSQAIAASVTPKEK